MYVCLCKGLTESDVRGAALKASLTGCPLVETLGLDDKDCCGRCARNIQGFVATAYPLPCDMTGELRNAD